MATLVWLASFASLSAAGPVEYIGRLGLYEDWEFIRIDGYQYSRVDYIASYPGGLTKSGYLAGTSSRYNFGTEYLGEAKWVADATTGITTRIGLFSGPEFTGADGFQDGRIQQLTEAGFVCGESYRYYGNSPDAPLGLAAWVANAATGTTTRIGLFSGSEYIRSDGYQLSQVNGISEAGYLYGTSNRYNGATAIGGAAWVANASTGTTTRIGLFSGSEFTSSDGTQSSLTGNILTESGYTYGQSSRYNSGSTHLGFATWVANATTGATTRIGLFSGPEFTRSDGYQNAVSNFVTESGYVSGTSTRYNDSTSFGEAAWVAHAATGTTTRIGFFSGPEFTRNDGYQASFSGAITESGYVVGRSFRYDGTTATQLGQATWAANAMTGATTRIGLYAGPEFTSDTGIQHSGYNILEPPTNTGYLTGASHRYNGGSTQLGQAAWVANVSTGATTRIGLYSGAEFTRNNGTQYSAASGKTESGYVIGHSSRYDGGSAQLGQAAWVANAATGTTTRIGLYSGPEFTHSNGTQSSTIYVMTESGYLRGHSNRYNGSNAQLGQAAWVADASTSSTQKVGLYDSIHTSTTGRQLTESTGITSSGLAWGHSIRFNGNFFETGQTAWLYDISLGQQINFELSVRASDGYSYSSILGVTESGIAYGRYTLFDVLGANQGDRAFIWTETFGILSLSDELSSEMALDQLLAMATVEHVNELGYLYGFGTLDGQASGSQGMYSVFVAPEPGRALLLFTGVLACLMRRRRNGGAGC